MRVVKWFLGAGIVAAAFLLGGQSASAQTTHCDTTCTAGKTLRDTAAGARSGVSVDTTAAYGTTTEGNRVGPTTLRTPAGDRSFGIVPLPPLPSPGPVGPIGDPIPNLIARASLERDSSGAEVATVSGSAQLADQTVYVPPTSQEIPLLGDTAPSSGT